MVGAETVPDCLGESGVDAVGHLDPVLTEDQEVVYPEVVVSAIVTYASIVVRGVDEAGFLVENDKITIVREQRFNG